MRNNLFFRNAFCLFLLLFVFPLSSVTASTQTSQTVQTADLNISLKDIARIEFGYHHSSFESQHTEFKLDVKNGQLTDGKIKAPLSILRPLLSGLRGMYPGTQPLYWQSWTDDYPHAWIYLYLNDGQMIQISSDSQYDGMFPWNVLTWSSEKAARPQQTYIQLRSAFFDDINALWRGVGEDGFPRQRYSADFWKSSVNFWKEEESEDGKITPNAVSFITENDSADTAPIWGASPESLAPFIPVLSQNVEIKTLLDAGYTPYDAVFALQVENNKSLKPIQYSGTIALAAPDRQDAVIGLVTIPLDDKLPVTTTLKAADSMQRVVERTKNHFLNGSAQMLTHLTFMLDTREEINIPTLECPEDPSLSLDGQVIRAVWNLAEPTSVYFYPIKDGRWSVDLDLQRKSQNWTDSQARAILKAWFPDAIAGLPPQNLQAINTSWKITFQPDVTLHDPQLLDHLKPGLPAEIKIHVQNPDKDGDYSFLSLNGRILLSEDAAAPVVVNCGLSFPDWYGPAYPIASVVTPDDNAPREDSGRLGTPGQWRGLSSSLPNREWHKTNWTSIAFSKPGFLHVLWSAENKGVYYADGWVNGTGWSRPQRLGDDAYSLRTYGWPDGEVHLFWDAGLRAGGSIHVWRPAGGVWQKPEHWTGLAYFTDVLRDSKGVLHIGDVSSDGLDSEFMHFTWSVEKGLSAPENISRHVGNTGNATTAMRFDSKGQLHAVWSHILEEKSLPDPITGETSDISAVFYAYRLEDGRWSKPEQLGTMAAYAHALSMELDNQDNPLIVWQADGGLVSRIKKGDFWQPAVELAKVVPPETPAEFGPGRQVSPTVEMQTVVNSQGQMIVSWLIPNSALKMAFWSGATWADSIDIVSPEDSKELQSEPLTLQMSADQQGRIHFVFFKGNDLYYASYDHGQVETRGLSMPYDGYGLPEASLRVDALGSVAIMGLPRSPSFAVRMPFTDLPATPTPTAVPTATPRPSPTPTKNPISWLPFASKDNPVDLAPWAIGLGILFVLLAASIGARIVFKKKE